MKRLFAITLLVLLIPAAAWAPTGGAGFGFPTFYLFDSGTTLAPLSSGYNLAIGGTNSNAPAYITSQGVYYLNNSSIYDSGGTPGYAPSGGSWASFAAGTGDFKADGSVPMTGTLQMDGNDLAEAGTYGGNAYMGTYYANSVIVSENIVGTNASMGTNAVIIGPTGSLPPMAAHGHLIRTSVPGNVLTIQQLDSDTYSAMRYVDSDGGERGAIGAGNAGAGIYSQSFLETFNPNSVLDSTAQFQPQIFLGTIWGGYQETDPDWPGPTPSTHVATRMKLNADGTISLYDTTPLLDTYGQAQVERLTVGDGFVKVTGNLTFGTSSPIVSPTISGTTSINGTETGYPEIILKTTDTKTAINKDVIQFKTTDASNWFRTSFTMIGATNQEDRQFKIQTVEEAVTSDGVIAMQADGGRVGVGTVSPVSTLQINSKASTKGVIIKGAASQTANALEIQASAGTVLVAVDASGNINTVGNINSQGKLDVASTVTLAGPVVMSGEAGTAGWYVQLAADGSVSLGAGTSGALNDLSDVNATATNGDSLIYSTAAGTWINSTVSGGGGSSVWTDAGAYLLPINQGDGIGSATTAIGPSYFDTISAGVWNGTALTGTYIDESTMDASLLGGTIGSDQLASDIARDSELFGGNFSDLAGSITDAQVPDNITISSIPAANIAGSIADAQIVAAIARDTELFGGNFSDLAGSIADAQVPTNITIDARTIAQGGTSATTASGARTALGLAIGSDVQGYSANMDTDSTDDYTVGGTDVALADGGTGASTAAAARAALEAPPPMESFVIAGSSLTTTTYPLIKPSVAITITDIHCITDTGTVIMELEEGTATAYDGGTVVDATITCDSNGAEDDGTLTNGTIAANAWIAARIGTEASSPTILGVTFYYTVD